MSRRALRSGLAIEAAAMLLIALLIVVALASGQATVADGTRPTPGTTEATP